MTHNLKTWPKFFEMVRSGRKTFELRVNDRNFQVGDILDLHEWVPETETYTGRRECRLVADVIDLAPLSEYVALVFAKTERELNNEKNAKILAFMKDQAKIDAANTRAEKAEAALAELKDNVRSMAGDVGAVLK